MKALIQRVTYARVTVDKETISEINSGLLLLLGVEKTDGPATAAKLCRKVINYRVFPDDQGRMNRSLVDTGYSLLVVPQFTLAADTRSGTRPGFSVAAPQDHAEKLFHEFLLASEQALGRGCVGRGQFGADMKVALENDGPVTFLLEVEGAAAQA
ncbi:D-aminoacyl-tRNA deacylase [Marinobacter orientalis]|uniref:D-aminoacyl-tRNA deacylase n=1 Tax=Marinobacter orientalis TaxID=1928859 RepID=A0A7Y0RFK3_9GAMM|nr:D-aminoacyl-tRNA deacylase [Marinobacter orientalis]NMT65311.1 D-tyrosyl-tRNA(Tyr) deacylase [Marinobacter orientalis]TGX47920.1 D-tyrosyl-tRNA(Tyr) deacylase [Marinobacter orientalis]